MQFTVPHTAAGLAELVARLARCGPPEQLAGRDRAPLGSAGRHPRCGSASGGADSPQCDQSLEASLSRRWRQQRPHDAYIVADVLRTDGHRFPSLQPPSDEIKALRALVRTRDDLVAERCALANQLRALARILLAWSSPDLCCHRLAHRTCLPRSLSHSPVRRQARRQTPRRLPRLSTPIRGRRHRRSSCWLDCDPHRCLSPAIPRPKPKA